MKQGVDKWSTKSNAILENQVKKEGHKPFIGT